MPAILKQCYDRNHDQMCWDIVIQFLERAGKQNQIKSIHMFESRCISKIQINTFRQPCNLSILIQHKNRLITKHVTNLTARIEN